MVNYRGIISYNNQLGNTTTMMFGIPARQHPQEFTSAQVLRMAPEEARACVQAGSTRLSDLQGASAAPVLRLQQFTQPFGSQPLTTGKLLKRRIRKLLLLLFMWEALS